MEIRVRKEYNFDSELQKYRCKIIAYLPTVEGSEKIDPLLRNGNVKFLDETLDEYWGFAIDADGKGFKRNSTYVWGERDEDIEKLEEKVREYIDNEIKKLKEVIQTNLKKFDAIPPDETEIWQL